MANFLIRDRYDFGEERWVTLEASDEKNARARYDAGEGRTLQFRSNEVKCEARIDVYRIGAPATDWQEAALLAKARALQDAEAELHAQIRALQDGRAE